MEVGVAGSAAIDVGVDGTSVNVANGVDGRGVGISPTGSSTFFM